MISSVNYLEPPPRPREMVADVPPIALPPEVVAALDVLSKTRKAFNDALNAYGAAAKAFRDAENDDRGALATSIVEGGKPPTPTTDKAETVLIAAYRQAAGASEAVDIAYSKVMASLRERSPGWRAQLEAESKAAFDRAAVVVQQLDELADAVMVAERALKWLDRLDESEGGRIRSMPETNIAVFVGGGHQAPIGSVIDGLAAWIATGVTPDEVPATESGAAA